MASTYRQKELKTRYPVTKGLTAETTKQTGNKIQLEPRGLLGIKSRVESNIKIGF